MKIILKTVVVLLIFPVLLSGCASIFSKTKYPVTINSTPDKANIVITDKKGHDVYSGVTPAIVKLKSSAGFFSNAHYTIKISIPGYQDFQTVLKANIEGWYFGNILFGGLIGMLIVDPATGAMWRINTKVISANLKADNTSLQIIDIKDVPENLKNQMVQLK